MGFSIFGPVNLRILKMFFSSQYRSQLPPLLVDPKREKTAETRKLIAWDKSVRLLLHTSGMTKPVQSPGATVHLLHLKQILFLEYENQKSMQWAIDNYWSEAIQHKKQRYKKYPGKHLVNMHQCLKQIQARYVSRILLFLQEEYFAQQGIFYSLRVSVQIKLADLLEECMQNYPEVLYLLL